MGVPSIQNVHNSVKIDKGGFSENRRQTNFFFKAESMDWFTSKKRNNIKEIGYVLNELIGIESKFIILNNSDELDTICRPLANHFKYMKTPIMIGGNHLSFTCIGIRYNDQEMNPEFLILVNRIYNTGSPLHRQR